MIDTQQRVEVAHLRVFNPEPASVVDGRPILYDALGTSSNGEASCSSCHVFGDFDSLAWDLGNPDDVQISDSNIFEFNLSCPANFHPIKGPMTTQTLRGMANNGPMHWRGDRSGANNAGGSSLDENAAFNRFLPAFDGLVGRGAPDAAVSSADMQKFADFILQVMMPPNPVRPFTNTLDTTTEFEGWLLGEDALQRRDRIESPPLQLLLGGLANAKASGIEVSDTPGHVLIVQFPSSEDAFAQLRRGRSSGSRADIKFQLRRRRWANSRERSARRNARGKFRRLLN